MLGFRGFARGLLDRALTPLWNWIKAQELKDLRERQQQLLSSMRSCGEGTHIWGRVLITGPEYMEVGSNVHIGDNAFIRAEGGLVVGDNTHISRNLVLYTINHRHDGSKLPYDEGMIAKRVVIGRNVWIGMNVCITPGTVIGDGAIIGMGMVVSGEVPPLAIVGNATWRVLGQRDAAHYRDLDGRRSYGGPDGIPFHPKRSQRP